MALLGLSPRTVRLDLGCRLSFGPHSNRHGAKCAKKITTFTVKWGRGTKLPRNFWIRISLPALMGAGAPLRPWRFKCTVWAELPHANTERLARRFPLADPFLVHDHGIPGRGNSFRNQEIREGQNSAGLSRRIGHGHCPRHFPSLHRRQSCGVMALGPRTTPWRFHRGAVDTDRDDRCLSRNEIATNPSQGTTPNDSPQIALVRFHWTARSPVTMVIATWLRRALSRAAIGHLVRMIHGSIHE
jgi:hypothetical protein